MKRRLQIILLISFVMCSSIFVSGCKMESMKTPEKLVEKPINDENNYKIYTELRKLTPIDSNFILPQNSLEVGKINVEDLNNDGNKEVVAFKKMQNETQGTSVINAYILRLDKNMNVLADTEKVIPIPGDILKYANFIDINNDGKKEILLQVSNRGYENIYVYSYENTNVKRIAEYSTMKYAIKLDFYDYDGDGKKECLALFSSLNSNNIDISKMVFEDDKINFIKYGNITDTESFERIYLINGQVAKGVYGTVIVYPTKAGKITDQLITYRNGEFVKNFNSGSYILKNDYLFKPFDINGDGILEFPKVETKYIDTSPKRANIISWYQWNGVSGQGSSLKLKNQVFYSYEYNFKVNLPESMFNRTYIKEKKKDGKIIYVFYNRELSSFDKMERNALFSISVIPKESDDYESKDKDNSNKNLIMDEGNVEYRFDLIDKNLTDGINSVEKIKKEFELLNK